MNRNDRSSAPDSNETKRKGKKPLILIGITIIALATAAFILSPHDSGECELPENSLFSSVPMGTYGLVDSKGEVIGKAFIARGITLGEPSIGTGTEKDTYVPKCFSSDSALQSMESFILMDEGGNIIPLIRGVGTLVSGDYPLP